MTTLTRDPGRLDLTGLRTSALHSLLSEGSDFVTADLRLGAFRTHQIAREICAHLGLPDLIAEAAPAPAERVGVPQSKIGRLIDGETRGDRITLDALRLAARVYEVVKAREPMTFCVLLGHHDIPWEPGDALFVRFFAQALRSTPHRLALISCDVEDPVVPPDWSVSWSGEADSAPSIPGLSVRSSDEGIKGSVNPALLWEHACRELELGGTGIALRLLQRAIPLARSLAERAVFQLFTQGAQVASGRFEEAANAPDPEERIPAEMRGWLWHTKGWALTMRNRPAEAEVCLKQARELVQKTGALEEYLYVMNISALNRLRSGDWEGALAFEEKIRSALAGVTTGGWQLRYINSMNIARLHRRRDDYDAAERNYCDAFATASGVPSDSDALYLDVCLARLDEARGLHAVALRSWIRAALRWVASPAPEAIAWRAISAILGAKPAREHGNSCDDVSEAFLGHLSAAAAGVKHDSSVTLLPSSGDAVAIVRSQEIAPEILSARGFHPRRGPGFWVLGTTVEVSPVISSTANLRLRSALSALIAPSLAGGVALRTIVVDDQLGRDLPESEAEMIAACLRLGLPAVEIDGRVIEVGAELRERLEGRLSVALSDAIESLALEPMGVVVSFKRYRDPQRLTGLAAEILRLAQRAYPTLDELRAALGAGAGGSLTPIVRALEQERIVKLSLPSEVTFVSLEKIA